MHERAKTRPKRWNQLLEKSLAADYTTEGTGGRSSDESSEDAEAAAGDESSGSLAADYEQRGHWTALWSRHAAGPEEALRLWYWRSSRNDGQAFDYEKQGHWIAFWSRHTAGPKDFIRLGIERQRRTPRSGAADQRVTSRGDDVADKR
jgi:hypothetical protein